MSAVVSRFPGVVRRLREAKGWSQEELAERSDLNRSYVGEIERGIAMPSLGTISKLALGLDLKPSSLLEHCE